MWLAYGSRLHSSTIYSHLQLGCLNKQPSSCCDLRLVDEGKTCWCGEGVSTFICLCGNFQFLLFSRETALLIDPKNSCSSSRQWVALVVGHELAHQWFGNLVTMVTSHNLHQLFATAVIITKVITVMIQKLHAAITERLLLKCVEERHEIRKRKCFKLVSQLNGGTSQSAALG